MSEVLTRTWSKLRFTAGMTILSAVFVVSHGLVLVHDLTRGEPAAGTGRGKDV
jgi:hypothetical protein